jgi:hypothetical protein
LSRFGPYIKGLRRAIKRSGGGNMKVNTGLGDHPGRLKYLEGLYEIHRSWYNSRCKPYICEL